MDISRDSLDLRTKEQKQDSAKKVVLESIKDVLEGAGLSMEDYSFSLFKKSSVKAPPNIQLFQTAAYIAATSLTPSANKILMYLLSLSEFENFISIDQRTLNEELNISLSSAEKAIKELTDNGIIIKIKHPSDKRRNDYFLNPMQAWKGKTLNRKIAITKLQQENMNQLSLFGEDLFQNQIRENEEIKAKKPSYKLNTLNLKEIDIQAEEEDENPNDYE
jgi:DNA-binding MarR family transcriptional regulator